MKKNKNKTFGHKCPICKIPIKHKVSLFERLKCKECKNFFFFVKIPEKFFVLS